MIPESFIQELLARVDIVDVVERYVPLKKGGANYQACCPFHTEKTPSFTVSPAKQFYHCFGCGAHGTALGFLMQYSGLSFVDAVEELAHSVGMQVPRVSDRFQAERAKKAPLTEPMARAAKFYR
ncbi:MAG TPA: CHC2 zinc finger domain-containing protein, partial [Rhodocyclaceae bacterium]|nr:CHC2 zinc finger domain-containing protein [Rhodocyclaceae bacterium]